jgi:Protein of unknown function, DUF488
MAGGAETRSPLPGLAHRRRGLRPVIGPQNQNGERRLFGRAGGTEKCIFLAGYREAYDGAVSRSGARKGTSPVIYTIGHSTRPIEDFIRLLEANGIKRLIDIRTIPKSRHNPQFNADSFAASLGNAGIDYVHMRELGGLRRARRDSPNAGWRNASFRGYADYMQTAAFEDALARAVELAREKPTALMCAEAVPWRCHRSLVADALTVRRIGVFEIIGPSAPKAHKLTPFARVRGKQISYPPEG